MKKILEFPNYEISQNGVIYNRYTGRILKPGLDTCGYPKVTLQKDKKAYTRLIHRLVLETFIGPRPKGKECCHNNGNPADNRLENLRWDTRKNNTLDSVRHGTHPCGEKNGYAKLNELQVRIIQRLLKFGELTHKEIAGVFDVYRTTIGRINSRKTWAWL